MAEPIRRHREREGRSRAHQIDAYEFALNLRRNHLLLTNFGAVSYRLAKELLDESMLDMAVEVGVAALFIDPENGQRLYAYIERG